MTRSPARTTAPPKSVASTEFCMRTWRFSRVLKAALSFCACASFSGTAEITSTSTVFSTAERNCFVMRGDFRQQQQAMILGQHAHEILHAGIEIGAGDIDDETGQIGRRPLRVLGERLRRADRRRSRASVFNPCDHRRKGIRIARVFECGLRVGPRDGGALSHAQPRRPIYPAARRESSDRSRARAGATLPRPRVCRLPCCSCSRARELSRATSSCA